MSFKWKIFPVYAADVAILEYNKRTNLMKWTFP